MKEKMHVVRNKSLPRK